MSCVASWSQSLLLNEALHPASELSVGAASGPPTGPEVPPADQPSANPARADRPRVRGSEGRAAPALGQLPASPLGSAMGWPRSPEHQAFLHPAVAWPSTRPGAPSTIVTSGPSNRPSARSETLRGIRRFTRSGKAVCDSEWRLI